jgi:protease IV
MQLNRIIALVLVAVCFVAAIFGIQRQSEEAFNLRQTLDRTSDRLELVSLEGAITGGRSTSTGAMAVRNRLLELRKVDSVKGVLLSINSPGGTVGASKEVYDAVMQLQKIKPVVVSMLDQGTSGGYYIASAATKIYANAGTLTGSIGVILNGLNVRELLNRVGIEPQTIKTGPYKDIFSSTRQLGDPERQLLQDLLQSTYLEFITDVSKGRNMDLEVVRKLADGRIYTGRQAKENKLIDEIGTLEDAGTDLRKLARAKFNLAATKELPINRSPSSVERLIDQLFNQSEVSFNLSSPLSTNLGDLAQKILKPNTSGLSSNDPPILLMPSWFN